VAPSNEKVDPKKKNSTWAEVKERKVKSRTSEAEFSQMLLNHVKFSLLVVVLLFKCCDIVRLVKEKGPGLVESLLLEKGRRKKKKKKKKKERRKDSLTFRQTTTMGTPRFLDRVPFGSGCIDTGWEVSDPLAGVFSSPARGSLYCRLCKRTCRKEEREGFKQLS